MTSYSRLEKKLRRACLDSDLSDDETIRVLAAVLVEIIISSTTETDQQRWNQMAKSAVYAIIEGVSIDTEAAKALGAELFRWMVPATASSATESAADPQADRETQE